MEEQIFKRLQMIYPVTTMDNSKCAAKEITSDIKEFIEWKDDLTASGIIFYDGNGIYSYKDYNFVLDDLYEYGLNIEK